MMQKKPTKRWKVGLLAAAALVGAALLIWLYGFLRPATWRYYTDDLTVRRLAKDVQPRLVLWEPAVPLAGALNTPAADVQEPAISPDGTKLAFTRGLSAGNADLFIARWDGRGWGQAEPLRALNSKFNEQSPAFSHDGLYLFFSTDRPGGLGGYDLWVARWDGAEYAWPEPLTLLVNSPFDDVAPQPSADDRKLYFSSNRPRLPLTKEDNRLALPELRQKYAGTDYDIFAADCFPTGYTNRAVERALSLLYSLRQSALSDPAVMRKLGGSPATEAAVDRALAWLAKQQESDGRWSIARSGGQDGHDVAATAFALLAYFGRGERHDQAYKYREPVAKGLQWLRSQQNKLTGDLRGFQPQHNGMYDQGIGALALAEAYGLTKDQDLFEAAQSAVYFIADAQNESVGGWRYVPKSPDSDLSVSGWIVMALKSAELSGIHVPAKTFHGVRKFLAAVSTGDGGGLYSYTGKGAKSTPAMNATGFFCSQLMGLSANTPKAFETAAFLKKAGLKSDDLYYVYYGTLSAYQNQGPAWREWSRQLQADILPLQEPDGSWPAEGKKFSGSMGRVITTSLMALSLQAHYRYTPLYGLGFEPAERPVKYSALSGGQLAPVPEYDRAKPVPSLNSPADELHVSVSSHGDFLYFASNRKGGYGGFDLYRSRLGRASEPPENLGPAINSAGDETAPAVNMAGFQLVFSSNRGLAQGRYRLQSSTSRVVYPRYAYRRPEWGWLWDNYKAPLLVALAALLVLLFRLVRRVVKTTPSPASVEKQP
ncbi:MAG: hypothetical protein NTV49_15900 [Kiritimatiellaeota bacterium]|nr:hypothetical protein [Kiritimatiellota bacterium]